MAWPRANKWYIYDIDIDYIDFIQHSKYTIHSTHDAHTKANKNVRVQPTSTTYATVHPPRFVDRRESLPLPSLRENVLRCSTSSCPGAPRAACSDPPAPV